MASKLISSVLVVVFILPNFAGMTVVKGSKPLPIRDVDKGWDPVRAACEDPLMCACATFSSCFIVVREADFTAWPSVSGGETW